MKAPLRVRLLALKVIADLTNTTDIFTGFYSHKQTPQNEHHPK